MTLKKFKARGYRQFRTNSCSLDSCIRTLDVSNLLYVLILIRCDRETCGRNYLRYVPTYNYTHLFSSNKTLFNLHTIDFCRIGKRTYIQFVEFNLQQFRLHCNFASLLHLMPWTIVQANRGHQLMSAVPYRQRTGMTLLQKILSTGCFNVLQLSGPLNCIIVIARTRTCLRCLNT
jgi:hypothetical protein